MRMDYIWNKIHRFDYVKNRFPKEREPFPVVKKSVTVSALKIIFIVYKIINYAARLRGIYPAILVPPP
jgi:hypothetical protein